MGELSKPRLNERICEAVAALNGKDVDTEVATYADLGIRESTYEGLVAWFDKLAALSSHREVRLTDVAIMLLILEGNEVNSVTPSMVVETGAGLAVAPEPQEEQKPTEIIEPPESKLPEINFDDLCDGDLEQGDEVEALWMGENHPGTVVNIDDDSGIIVVQIDDGEEPHAFNIEDLKRAKVPA